MALLMPAKINTSVRLVNNDIDQTKKMRTYAKMTEQTEQKEQPKVEITVPLMNVILNYMAQRPYVEVVNILNAINAEVGVQQVLPQQEEEKDDEEQKSD